MLSGSKTMQNRSLSKLPSHFAPAETSNLDETDNAPNALEILEFTFLHFHSVLELGVCAQGRGVCVVEGVEYPFEAGDAQIVFPFQTHLSRSVGRPALWYWLSLNPLKLLGQWGAPNLTRLERLLYTQMGLCGIIDRGKYPLIAELIRRIALPGARERRLSCLQTLIEELASAVRGTSRAEAAPGARFSAARAGDSAGAPGAESGARPHRDRHGERLRDEHRDPSPRVSAGAGAVAAGISAGVPAAHRAAPAAEHGRIDHANRAVRRLSGRVRLQPPVPARLQNPPAPLSPDAPRKINPPPARRKPAPSNRISPRMTLLRRRGATRINAALLGWPNANKCDTA